MKRLTLQGFGLRSALISKLFEPIPFRTDLAVNSIFSVASKKTLSRKEVIIWSVELIFPLLLLIQYCAPGAISVAQWFHIFLVSCIFCGTKLRFGHFSVHSQSSPFLSFAAICNLIGRNLIEDRRPAAFLKKTSWFFNVLNKYSR